MSLELPTDDPFWVAFDNYVVNKGIVFAKKRDRLIAFEAFKAGIEHHRTFGTASELTDKYPLDEHKDE